MRGDCDLYRQQHRELLAVAALLRDWVEDRSHSEPGGHREIRPLLKRLAGKLMVHLQMEDRSLYPELLQSDAPELRATALRFQEGMGPLRAASDLLFRRWLAPAAIERAPAAFDAELRPFLLALYARIASEDAELFPLADQRR